MQQPTIREIGLQCPRCLKTFVKKWNAQFHIRKSEQMGYCNGRDRSQVYQRRSRVTASAPKSPIDPSKVFARQLGNYGITMVEFATIYKRQEGKCAICKIKLIGKQIDHDHRTDKVRGLLCQKCNRGLGHFLDDPELLLSAYNYLMNHAANN